MRGGFTSGSRLLFAALAALALSIVIVRDERAVTARLRAASVRVLLALAVLAAASSLWTIATPSAAVRWALVIAALAATALVAADAAEHRSVTSVMAVIAVLAAAEAVIGLTAAGLRVEPYAQRIGGVWRPGGTFEYPPALALLQISAMPLLLRGMFERRRALALGAAAATAAAGAVVALVASRAEIGLGLAVLAIAALASQRTLGVAPSRARLAVVIPVVAGIGARLVAGGHAPPGTGGGDAGRLVALATILLIAAGAWALAERNRSAAPELPATESRLPAHAIALLLAILVLAGAVALSPSQSASGDTAEPVGGVSHGRTAEWQAALETGADRPLAGAGAESYLQASARHQGRELTRYAHNLPLESWAELGIPGLALVLALYAVTGRLLWRLRTAREAWLVAPAVAAFLIANLFDWPWHLAGSGAIWAAALGACLALEHRAAPV